MNDVWKHAPVDQGTLLVLLALADAAEERSRTCYPGVETLALKARLSERQVQYCLQRLREVGIITVQRNASPVKTNLYRIVETAKWSEVRDAIIAPHGMKAETQSATRRDEVDCVTETQLVAPEPSVTVSREPPVYAREQMTLLSEEVAPKVTATMEAFNRFWAVYPKKVAKPDAQKAWAKAVKVAAPDRIIAAAERYARWLTEGKPGEFRPEPKNPQGWLNSRRWDDPALLEAPASRAEPRPIWGEVVR